MDLLTVTLLTPRQIASGQLRLRFGLHPPPGGSDFTYFSLRRPSSQAAWRTSQLAAALSVVVASATLFCTLGLFVSSRAQLHCKRPAIITYAALLGIINGMAVMAMALFRFLNNATRSTRRTGQPRQDAAVLSALFFVSSA